MGRTKSEVGIIGEDIACEYLMGKGFKIVSRNVKHLPMGEMDIIARDKRGLIVFVEVKTGQGGNNDYRPEVHYNADKAYKTNRLAQFIANKPPKIVGPLGYRVDLIVVDIIDPLLTDWKKDCVIRHYENVVAT